MKIRIDRKEDGVWLWIWNNGAHLALRVHDPKGPITKRISDTLIGQGWMELTPTTAPEALPGPEMFDAYNRIENNEDVQQ